MNILKFLKNSNKNSYILLLNPFLLHLLSLFLPHPLSLFLPHPLDFWLLHLLSFWLPHPLNLFHLRLSNLFRKKSDGVSLAGKWAECWWLERSQVGPDRSERTRCCWWCSFMRKNNFLNKIVSCLGSRSRNSNTSIINHKERVTTFKGNPYNWILLCWKETTFAEMT